MSQRSLLLGTKEFLLKNILYNNQPLSESLCDVMPDGRPPNDCGEFFMAIHPGGSRGTNYEILDIVHQINITLTIRISRVPFDRIGRQIIVKKQMGLSDFIQLLIQVIHMNYNILLMADSFIGNEFGEEGIIDGFPNKWIEPLRFNTCSPPRIVGGDWFHSERDAEAGIIQTVTFGDARRVQFSDFQPNVITLDPNSNT